MSSFWLRWWWPDMGEMLDRHADSHHPLRERRLRVRSGSAVEAGGLDCRGCDGGSVGGAGGGGWGWGGSRGAVRAAFAAGGWWGVGGGGGAGCEEFSWLVFLA